MQGCKVGSARVTLTPESSGGTAAWGPLGRRDAIPPSDEVDQVYATALAMEDARGRRVVVVNADVCWGSRLIWEASADASGLDPSQVIYCGTHTHEGPGHRFGAPMFTWFGNADPRTATAGTERLKALVSRVVRDALDDLAPGGVTVVRDHVVGVASNRALPAWRHYPDDERDRFLTVGPGSAIDIDAPVADRCRDPRLTVLVASRDDGSRRCALAWYAVHGTSLGATWPTFSADLWGVAREVAERDGSLMVGFGGGSSGDVSPLPLTEDGRVRRSADRPTEQGRPLADSIGSRIGTILHRIAAAARPTAFELGVQHEMWRPRSSGLPVALSGLAQAGAGVDGPTERWEALQAGVQSPLYRKRGWRGRLVGRGQSPKIGVDAAYSPVPLPLGIVYRFVAPKALPLHVLRVGDHVFATVPGEPTTMAGWRVEEAVRWAAGASTASVIGYAGAYGGYWVTPEEYAEQRYEAAATIFGRHATTRLTERLVELATRLGPVDQHGD